LAAKLTVTIRMRHAKGTGSMGQHWMQRAPQRQGGRAQALYDDLRVIGRMDAALTVTEARTAATDWRAIGDLLRDGEGGGRPTAPLHHPLFSPENSGCP
jgi:hypothetical protein